MAEGESGVGLHIESEKTVMNVARFTVTTLNFLMTVTFAIIMLSHAFSKEDITGNQVFHADRTLQTSGMENFPASILATFIKQSYGSDTAILGVIDETTKLQKIQPTMYEVSGSDSILRIEAVHCNFLFFSSLWIASAFALTMVQLPWRNQLYWSHARVVLVHIWNLIGLVVTTVVFTATTKWAAVPTSNLFYALIGQVMGWMYQYFHMVECTQLITGNLQVEYLQLRNQETDNGLRSTLFATEMRKIIFMEFSVVFPMMLVSGIMPGAIGIDEWRIQTILFASWTLFALLGLHLRFRKSLEKSHIYRVDEPVGPVNNPNGIDPNNPESKEHRQEIGIEHGLDALGYLTYAIVVVYFMLCNALWPVIFYDSPWASDRVMDCRYGTRILFVVCGFFVIETIFKTIEMRVFPHWVKPAVESINTLFVSSLVVNLLYIIVGSFLVKVFLFVGMVDVNQLSYVYT